MAGYDLDQELAQFEGEAPPEEKEAGVGDRSAVAEAPEAPAVEAATDADPYAELLKHEALPESLRGKKPDEAFREVLNERKRLAQEAAQAGFQKNEAESRAKVAERLLEVMTQRQQAPAPQPRQLQNEDFWGEPAQVVPELINRRVQEQVEPVMQQLRQMQDEVFFANSERAREAAMRSRGYDAETMAQLTRPVAAVMAANRMSTTDPNAWSQAIDIMTSIAPKLAPRVEMPKAGAPPAGQARSVAATSTKGKLSARDSKNLADLASSFGIKAGTPAYDALVADIVELESGRGEYR